MGENMERNEDTKTDLNIYQRLARVMMEVKRITKQEGAKGLQYSFISHDSVCSAIREPFIENGIVALPTVVDHSQEGNRTSATVDVRFQNIDNPDDCIIVRSFGYGVDKQDKGPGKAISYAVKYAYLKALSLETGDDPERDNIDATGDKISDPQLINLREICESYDLPVDATLKSMAKKVFKLKKIEDLPAEFFQQASEMLDKKGKQQSEAAVS